MSQSRSMTLQGAPRSALLWSAAYVVLALAATFPLVLRLSSAVPHDLGDPLLSASILWWNAHVLPLTARWWNGFAFAPAPGSIAFSDHRLGLSLLASPLQWLGCSPITAYNITLLATFPLCAMAAHWLGHTLTGRHDAAALCGLAYGFNPYRAAHIEHLELLAAFAMPAALAALHLYADTRRVKWMVVFALALVLQGLSASYYLLFFGVLIALWLLWFCRVPDWHLPAAVAVACLVSAAALSPLAIGYVAIHRHYGFTRVMSEIVLFSGDVTSYVTGSPLLALWGWTSRLNGPERQLFPGFTISVLALAGAVAALARHQVEGRSSRLSGWLLGAAAILAGVAAAAAVVGPWQLAAAGLRLSVAAPHKPLSLALVAAIGALAALPVSREAYRGRSLLGFYLVATAVLFLCSLGPAPAFRGVQILYEPPYAWLMQLPIFSDGVRVPARFAMLTALALSVSGALAFSRFRLGGRTGRVVLAALALGIVADGWMAHLPLLAVPEAWSIPQSGTRTGDFGAVLELPPSPDVERDAAAMYRASAHGHPVANGYSGYIPRYYAGLKLALDAMDPTALDPLTAEGPLLIAVDRTQDPDGRWPALLATEPGATARGTDARWTFFTLAASGAAPPPCTGNPVPIRGASDNLGPVALATVTDGNPLTWWGTPRAQQAGEWFMLDLGVPVRACAVATFLGPYVEGYPRMLKVETSLDGATWTETFNGRGGGATVRGALERPKEIPVRLPLASTPARYIRLTLLASDDKYGWMIPDVVVSGQN